MRACFSLGRGNATINFAFTLIAHHMSNIIVLSGTQSHVVEVMPASANYFCQRTSMLEQGTTQSLDLTLYMLLALGKNQ